MEKACNRCGKDLVGGEVFYCEECRQIVRQEYSEKENYNEEQSNSGSTIKLCKNCNKEIDNQAEFCRFCGHKIEINDLDEAETKQKMFCSKCGKEILDEAVICVGCGCPIKSINQTTTSGTEVIDELLSDRLLSGQTADCFLGDS